MKWNIVIYIFFLEFSSSGMADSNPLLNEQDSRIINWILSNLIKVNDAPAKTTEKLTKLASENTTSQISINVTENLEDNGELYEKFVCKRVLAKNSPKVQ